jgi:hypothetical protein
LNIAASPHCAGHLCDDELCVMTSSDALQRLMSQNVPFPVSVSGTDDLIWRPGRRRPVFLAVDCAIVSDIHVILRKILPNQIRASPGIGEDAQAIGAFEDQARSNAENSLS